MHADVHRRMHSHDNIITICFTHGWKKLKCVQSVSDVGHLFNDFQDVVYYIVYAWLSYVDTCTCAKSLNC